MIRKFLVVLAIALVVFPISAHAQKQAKADSPKVHVIKDALGSTLTFTDYGPCQIEYKVNMSLVFITATKGDSVETAHVSFFMGDTSRAVTQFQNEGDRTKGPDLINRLCTETIRAIPNPKARQLAMAAIVE